MNIEHVLAWHFTGPPGSSILPELAQAASLRLLRLLARQLLDTSRYSDLVFHTRGARGAIYRARQAIKAGAAPQQLQYRPVMIKVVELPQSGFDASKLPEVYGEVSILERFAQSLRRWSA
ncbi:protein kinase domain-containing protein, partial [Haematococcus lacustris]